MRALLERAGPSLVALVILPAVLAASPAPGLDPPDDPCARLVEIDRSKVVLCTHGGDRLSPGDTPGAPDSNGVVEAAGSVAPCLDGGGSGKRIEVIYGTPQDRVDDYAGNVAEIRKRIANVDFNLDASTPTATGQHYRWLCEDSPEVTVREVTLVAVGDDGDFTFGDMVHSLQSQVALGLGPRNFVSEDRIYVVFVEGLAYGATVRSCGWGSIENDDTPAASTNGNAIGPAYSLIACWKPGHVGDPDYWDLVVAHELSHNLGAVQLSAPHSSGSWHCYDVYDLMCYDDGGSYFAGGGQLRYDCPSEPLWAIDCRDDDYYSPLGAGAGYLATHWNLVDSPFLTDLTAACDITGTPGDDLLLSTAATETICGLGGVDTVSYAAATFPVAVDLEAGSATGHGADALVGVENVTGSVNADTLSGSAGANALRGTRGRDLLRGGDGNDRLYGGYGADRLSGEAGDDALSGGPGTDVCAQGPGTGTRVGCES